MFKNKIRLGHNFLFKDRIPKDLTSGVVYNFQCGLCNKSHYGERVKHLNVRNAKRIDITPLTKRQVKPKESSIASQLLFCNHWASYVSLSILTHYNKKFSQDLKENLLILRDQSFVNKNITSTLWYLFDRP